MMCLHCFDVRSSNISFAQTHLVTSCKFYPSSIKDILASNVRDFRGQSLSTEKRTTLYNDADVSDASSTLTSGSTSTSGNAHDFKNKRVTSSHKWPLLSKLAARIFPLPASSTSAERVWSSTSNIISKNRARLTTSRSEKLVSIYWNGRILQRALKDSEQVLKFEFRVDEDAHALHHTTLILSTADDNLEDDTAELLPPADTQPINLENQSQMDDIDNDDDFDEFSMEAIAISKDRAFPYPVQQYEASLSDSGSIIIAFFAGISGGWFKGSIIEYDEERKAQKFVFTDDLSLIN